ncbi:hypothetical protein BLNAU_106 [Blattamonas nauphoetae]|uniref:FMR1-interacting protein 1 conserved domain-containing protein n=1 Tax=Blattamonas nauphoetae TaxID=2049346 RepID=A0ABQ9YMA6_9EUKA|nr:hypothetical protein BLNAU_106 [Blattamonas nauphoetae]
MEDTIPQELVGAFDTQEQIARWIEERKKRYPRGEKAAEGAKLAIMNARNKIAMKEEKRRQRAETQMKRWETKNAHILAPSLKSLSPDMDDSPLEVKTIVNKREGLGNVETNPHGTQSEHITKQKRKSSNQSATKGRSSKQEDKFRRKHSDRFEHLRDLGGKLRMTEQLQERSVVLQCLLCLGQEVIFNKKVSQSRIVPSEEDDIQSSSLSSSPSSDDDSDSSSLSSNHHPVASLDLLGDYSDDASSDD